MNVKVFFEVPVEVRNWKNEENISWKYILMAGYRYLRCYNLSNKDAEQTEKLIERVDALKRAAGKISQNDIL